MNHSLHFDYENFAYGQGHPLDLAVHTVDYQSHGLGRCAANSYLPEPFTGQGTYDPSYASWVQYDVPCVPQNSPPSYEEASACWPGELPEQGQDMLYLHAPVPLVGCPPILRANPCYLDEVRISAREEHPLPRFPDRSSQPITPPQATFPTPSELLVELSNKRIFPAPASPRVHPGYDAFTPAMPLPHSPAEYSSVDTMSTPDFPFTALPPGDSDTVQEAITPHEKKRYYLECLEHYVIFLHEHCRRIDFEPPPLERAPGHRCLNSRSIRSLLIHMEKLDEQMKNRIIQEEQRFLRLRDALQQQEAEFQAVHGVQREA